MNNILKIGIIVIVLSILFVPFTGTESYTETQWYTVSEPYNDIEYYTVQEAYNVDAQVTYQSEIYSAGYSGWLKDSGLKNTLYTFTNIATESHRMYATNVFGQAEYEFVLTDFQNTQYTYTGITSWDITPVQVITGYETKYRTETTVQYRDVQKSREVTKYRDAQKSREVIKTREVTKSIFQRLV